MKLNIGVIGYGYWGPNIARNIHQSTECTLFAIADDKKERQSLIKRDYPEVLCTSSAEIILNNPEVDAVAIVTPVSTHYDLAFKALQDGKHVLLEKPMATTSSNVSKLIQLAKDKGVTLMVDHTFLYTGAVEKMKEIIDSGEIGEITYIDSTRINLGIYQHDVNVLWDLASHDISIANYILGRSPGKVQAVGISHTKNEIENIAYLIMHYDENLMVHISTSWSSPVKLRQMLIGGDKKMIVYNDIEPTDKLKVYDKGIEMKSFDDKRNILIDYRLGDVRIPKIHIREALSGVVSDFLNAIKHQKTPRSNSISGLEVVRILEAADLSIKNHGMLVDIDKAD